MPPSLDNALSAHAIPDSLIAEGYEKTARVFLASIKTAIALAEFHFQPQRIKTTGEKASPTLGFTEGFSCQPFSLAIVLFPHTLQGAAQLCAATILAQLSGVGNVIAISLGGRPTSGALATLALCGIEDAYQFPSVQELPLRDFPCGTPLVCLDYETIPERDFLRLECLRKHNPFYAARSPKSMALLSPASFNPDVLAFCHGAAAIPQGNWSPDIIYDVVFYDPASDEIPADLRSQLFLEPGCEGFWLFPDLTPEFFIKKTFKLGMLANHS